MDIGFEKDKAKQYLTLVIRRKELILLIFLIAIGITIIRNKVTTPIYESTANFQIEEMTRESSLIGELVRWARYNPIFTEMEIFRSRTIAEEVATDLHLDEVIIYRSKGLQFKLNGLRVDDGEKGKIFTVSFVDPPDRYIVSDGGGKAIGEGEVGTPFVGNPISFLLTEVSAQEGDHFRIKVKRMDELVSDLVSRISIQERGTQTNLLTVSYKSENPELTRDVLAKWLEVYIRRNLSRRSQETGQALDFIENQLEVTRKNLEKAEDEMDIYRATDRGLTILSNESGALIAKLGEIQRNKVEITLRKKEVEDLVAMFRRGRSSKDFLLSKYSLDDPMLTGLVNDLINLLIQKETLLFELTENHPQVQVIAFRVERIKKRIIEGLESTRLALEKKDKALKDLVDSYEGQLKSVPSTERQLARLVRAMRVNDDVYTFLLKKHEEARVARAATVSNIRIIDPPFLPSEPIEPQKKRNLVLGAATGLFGGLSLVLLLEVMDTSIKTTEEIERGLGLSLFGLIPAFPFGRGKKGRKERQRAMTIQYIADHLESRSPVAEAYRSLRTNIQFGMLKEGSKSFLITSAGPGEGKSTTVINLGIVISQAHNRVVLIDCDLRKPVLHTVFGMPLEPGMTNVLLGKTSWRESLKPTSFEGLYIITGGTIPPNPTELLSAGKMEKVLEELKKEFDYIFFDSPPVILVSDAAILGRIADGVFLIIESEKTTIEAARKSKASLETVHAKVLGAIFNNMKRSAGYGYYYYPYYYSYGYYGYYGYYGRSGSKPQGWSLNRIIAKTQGKLSNWFSSNPPK